eukprot:TRINITY_DN13486_c0_g1_i1.p1 TRINITY_DN13486_c0_g1~~TRINITY_DN13486_c0_g1_i1.p1  ORF type:complete len:275 (-),score=36.09 TRINITY_DN13486_c0_g1_i1:6-830(-)
MKLNARLKNIDLFMRFVQTVDKIGKDAIVHVTQKKIMFILTSDMTKGVQVWSGMDLVLLVEDFVVESLNNNEIAFKLNLENLLRSLKSGLFAQEVSMRLTKRNNLPFLTFVNYVQGKEIMTIVQNVPITLLTAAQLAQLTEPHLTDPEVNILMPPLKLLKNAVERMKNISDCLIINANMAGQLTLRVETDLVSIATFFKNLQHPVLEGKSPPRPDPNQVAEVRVNIKKFSKFLYSHQVSPADVICCLVEGEALVTHVLLENLFITYYIPVLLQP